MFSSKPRFNANDFIRNLKNSNTGSAAGNGFSAYILSEKEKLLRATHGPGPDLLQFKSKYDPTGSYLSDKMASPYNHLKASSSSGSGSLQFMSKNFTEGNKEDDGATPLEINNLS